ncbi:MAG TPA: hypothetical protein VMG12_16240 [Polyangiaceae bacterium]|nr:hypothetical protein [Polyangiaceae bacterium]
MQTCNGDGSGYSACACPDETGNGGSAGSGGSGGGSNGGAAGSGAGADDPIYEPLDRVVGAPCNTDADCPAAPNGDRLLTCITPTSAAEFGTGSPQGGYCTAVCEGNEDCVAIDGLTACGLIDDATNTGYCIALCQPGGDDGLVKCAGQNDAEPRAQACFAIPNNPNIGACFPVCQSDAACGNGQFCDLGATGLGLCVTTPPVGGDVGAPCTPDTAETDCKSGVCVTLLDPDTGEDAGNFCSANCTFGLIEGCGFDLDVPDGTREAVCIRPQENTDGGGDIGFCFELCDEDTDCAQADAGWICEHDLQPNAVTLVGRTGECVPPAFATGDGGIVVDAGN